MYSRVFIIIDALDECQVSEGSRTRFLSDIFNLQAKYGANIFATSRSIPEIIDKFKGSTLLEIRARSEDVQRYLEGHMEQLQGFVQDNQELQREIKNEISYAVGGMFLLAQIYLASLTDKYTLKAIRNTLKLFKKQGQGSSENKQLEALAQAYEEAMKRINEQKPGSQQLAQNVLSWITCAKRPLSTSELQHALAVEVGNCGLDEENFTRVEDMVSVCAGLVTVDEESGIIRIFESGFCRTNDEFEERLQRNPLYDYAARNWGHHAHAASAEVDQLVVNLLKSEAKVSGCSQAMIAWGIYFGNSQTVPKQVTGVHLAAYFGLEEVIVVLLEGGYDLDSKDSYYRTPLSLAAENGHEAVVKLLLEEGAELETKDRRYGRTPLSWAAEDGHEAVVKLLLEEGAELETKSWYSSWTPSWVPRRKVVVKLLLEKG
ncbi:uncharacterized protein K444DRAFT_702104 [Hyaloscypha bicolor E]|uniref:Uncharacterized protein n=1 Tax=Hyaloscypha bicolor E TaxID=1095630 RepID=A0A2J6TTI1_9HELO|nr:uncharacterized protein K444DRAFT_702104 [Hyaloscypha bicolor E]PMD66306.1 hypothetical protein K444DRAFT_702104 [Hyaloscypha bicolor E]